MRFTHSTHPWILGPFAVYASNLHTAREIHELITHQSRHDPYGTVVLDTGEEIDWIDMRIQLRRDDAQ